MKKKVNGQIVIFGKPGHAEVIGLLGQIKNDGVLVTEPRCLRKLIFKPVYLFAQTTMSVKEYDSLSDNVKDGRKWNSRSGKKADCKQNNMWTGLKPGTTSCGLPENMKQ